MKKIIKVSLFSILFALLLISCVKKIQLNNYLKNVNKWQIYGLTPERNFYIQDTLNLPLKVLHKTELRAGLNYSSVTTMDEFIFVGDLKGYVYKIDINKGGIKNYLNYKQPILTNIIVKENELIIPISSIQGKESFIAVFNLVQAKESKRIVLEGSVEKDPILVDNSIYLTTTKGVVYKLKSNYNIEWKIDLRENTYSHLAFGNNLLVVGTLSGKIFLISSDGKIILSKDVQNPIKSGFIIKDSLIYFGDDKGYFYCLDTKSGQWVFNKKLGSSFKSIPSLDENNIFIGSVDGTVYCLKQKDGKILWKKNFGGIINNSILIIGNKLIVPNVNKKILILDKITGKILQEISLDGRVKLSPVYIKDKLIVGCDDKKIIALSN